MNEDERQAAARRGEPREAHPPACPALEQAPWEKVGKSMDLVEIGGDTGGGGPSADVTRETPMAPRV